MEQHTLFSAQNKHLRRCLKLISALFLLLTFQTQIIAQTGCDSIDDEIPDNNIIENPIILDETGNAVIEASFFDNGTTDNCDTDLEFGIDETTFDCMDVGSIQLSFTATDDAGNFSISSIFTTVVDATPPTAICQTATVQLDATVNGTLLATAVDNGSNDACGIASVGVTFDGLEESAAASVSVDCNTGTTATLFVTDVNDNVSTCTAAITIEGNSGLTAECQDITVQLNGNGNATILVSQIDNGSQGACSMLTLDNDSFNCADVGTNIVELTVSNGTTSVSCTAVVLVEDDSAPDINCQTVTIQLDETGTATVNPADANDGSTDNCTASEDLIFGIFETDEYNCNDIGGREVSFTATDESGNLSGCSGFIIVEDNILPTISCPGDLTVAAGEACTFTGLNETISADDNCSIFQTTFSLVNLNAALFDTVSPPPTVISGSPIASLLADLTLDLGENEFDFETEDIAGNTAACDFTINVEDQTSPEALCQDVAVNLDADGNGMISIAQINNGSNDNCTAGANLTFSLDQTDFTCSEIGENTVTLTVTDDAGNEDTCTATVTVSDFIAPEFPLVESNGTCGTISLNVDENGLAEAVTISDLGVTDNCTQTSDLTIVDAPEISCDDIDENPILRNFVVRDESGTLSFCSYEIILIDNILPTISCPNDVTVNANTAGGFNNFTETVTFTENCFVSSLSVTFTEPEGSSSTFTLSINNPSISEGFFGFGTTNIQYIINDISGNTAQCSFNLTVEDQSPPTAICQNASVVLDGNEISEITPDQINNGSNDTNTVEANLLFSLNQTDFDCSGVGENTVTLTVTDEAGNEDTCTATVTVEDNMAPDIDCQNIIIELNEAGTASVNPAAANDGSTDNCTEAGDIIFSLLGSNEFNCSDVGSNFVQFRATDESGNASQCTSFIIVEDNISPTLSCPGDLTVAAGETCTFTGLNETVSADDNCSIFQTTFSLVNLNNALIDSIPPPPTVISGSPIASLLADLTLDLGENEFDFETEDIARNTAACDFTINVIDQTAPEALCQDASVELNADGIGMLSIAQINNGSNDNCTATANLAFALDQTDFDCSEIGENTVMLSVTDAAGNEGTCTGTVSIEDNLSPQFPLLEEGICGTISLNVDENGLVEALTISDLGVTDNCTQISDLLIVNPSEFSCADIDENPIVRNFMVADEAGNGSNCDYEIILIDNFLPTISCPADVTLNANVAGGFNNFSEIISFTENCSVNSISVVFTDADNNSSTEELDINNPSLAEFLFDFGTTNVQITIEDKGGNSAQCSFNLRVEDQTAPTSICQDASVELDGNGNGSISPDQINNGSNDTNTVEADLLFALNQTSFDCSAVGVNTVTLTVTDDAGNEDTCTATVTVEDDDAPDIDCQSVTIQLNEAGTATVNPADANDGSTDNCTEAGNIIFALLEANEFDCSDVGANFVTFTATDESSNSSQCSGEVIVEDNVPPMAICQPIAVQLIGSGSGTLAATDVNNESSDACGIASLAVTLDGVEANSTAFVTLDCDDLSGATATLFVTDVNNNTASCTAAITVEDMTDLNAVCQDITVQLDENGNAIALAADVNDGSGAACSVDANLTLMLDNDAFTCADIGDNTVELTVTNTAGNTANCTATITVEDNIAPVLTCPENTTVAAGNDCTFTGLNEQVIAEDNCSIFQTSFSLVNLNNASLDSTSVPSTLISGSPIASLLADLTLDLGENEFDFETEDIAGNTAVCDFTINVTDQTGPTAICQDATVQLDDDGEGTLSLSQINNGSNDNCTATADLTFSLSQSNFDCSATGDNTVTLTVADAAGNEGNCTATVSVVDIIDPEIICQTVTIQLNAAGVATVNPADANDGTIDNCTDAGDIIFSLSGSNEFSCSDVGDNSVTFTATDESGNTSQCEASITVEDNVVPTATCQTVTVQIDEDGNGTLSATEVDNGSSDICGINTVLVTLDGIQANAAESVNFDCDNVNETPTATLFVTDVNGNTSNCTATITIEDNIAPVVNCIPVPAIFVNGDCIVPALSETIFDGSVSDNCDNLTFTEIYTDADGNELSNRQSDDDTDITLNRIDLPLGVTTVSLTFTDAGGNSDNCTFNISVLDNTPPMAICQDITAQLDETGNVTIATADIDNGSTDNCSNLTFALNNTDFTCADVGMNTVTLTATDESGNSSECDGSVTVEDNVAPTVTCQSVTVQIDEDGNGTLSATEVDNGSSDICGINTVLVTLDGVQANAVESVNFDCDDVNETPTATLFVTDVNGNTSNCTATITIEDNIAPLVNCIPVPAIFVNGDCIVPALSATIFDGSVSDNCNNLTFTEIYTDAEGNELSNRESDDDTDITLNRIDLPLGVTTVSLTFTDAGGNSDNCTFNISVLENTPPMAVCQDITAQLDETGNVTIAATDIDNNSTDNCSSLTFTLDNAEFTCADIGTNTVMLTATDDSSNASTCTAIVTVEDNVAPEAICQEVTVQLDANGNGALLAADVDNGSSDACGIDDLSVTFDGIQTNAIASLTVDCDDLAGLTATLFVTDENGNTSDCTAAITVQDSIEPIAECTDFTVSLEDNGVGSISPINIDNGSTDNCTEAANLVFALVGNTTFSCGNVGAHPIILSVTDESDNTGTCTAIVTVEDNGPAVIECRQPVSTTTSLGICGVENQVVLEPFVLSDNCGAADVSFTRIPAGNDFPVGETVLNWTATDVNGNISTCQSLVIIQDNEAPTIDTWNTVIDFLDSGSCLAQVVVSADIFDNCGVASVTGTGVLSLPFGIHPTQITVTDINGNVTVQDITIVVHDDWNPIFSNCPVDTVFLQAEIDGTAPYPVPMPVATDNCGVPTITNDLPEYGFPIGSSVVTFTAEDEYGNTTDCVVNIEVEGGIALHPQGDIESSLAENEATQNVSWNALNAATFCELCEETELEGFQYVGTWWGHQYFLANESSLTRDDASLIAEGYDAHLAVINDAAENAYLTEALDGGIRSAWIGLLPEFQDEEWTFTWDNGDAFDFDVLNFDSITVETRIILGNDGIWKQATDTEEKYFLLERPCVDFVQTGPIYAPEVEEGEDEIPAVLLRSGDAWPEGAYEVTYALTDMCGNEAGLNFGVNVLPEIAEYCTSIATNNSVWIEKIVFHDLLNESEDNDGYADFTEDTTTMNIGDGVILLRLEAGGNEAEDSLFWNIYLDANSDGDFFDAGEMLYQVASREAVEVNLTLPIVSLENARLRVMVSRYAFAAPCGDTYVGEIEDYNLNLLIPEDYARAACEVQLAGLSGEITDMTAELEWTVNSACPIENYTIEYSKDGQDFVTIIQIAEEDATDNFYSKDYTTALPFVAETVDYRIRVQPFDQPAFYTNTLSFDMPNSMEKPLLYPNPADNVVCLTLANFVGTEGVVVIYDNMGKVRLTKEFDANTGNEMRLDLRKFTDGIYHVSIEAKGKRIQSQRLVVNKLYGWDAANK